MKLRGLHVIRSGGLPALSTERAKKAESAAADEPQDGRLATLEVDFSTFDSWYRIDDFWEGTFLERTVAGAFKKTIAERGSQVKILFNHGMDLHIGDKALSVPELIEERAESPHLEGPLWDTSYNRDLLPGLRAGAYGSSFMFEVIRDSWEYDPPESEHNPDALPERTISEVRLYEAGPVTWPANPASTAGVRSGTGWFAEELRTRDAQRYDTMSRSFEAFRTMNKLNAAPPAPEKGRHAAGLSASARRRRLTILDLGAE